MLKYVYKKYTVPLNTTLYVIQGKKIYSANLTRLCKHCGHCKWLQFCFLPATILNIKHISTEMFRA